MIHSSGPSASFIVMRLNNSVRLTSPFLLFFLVALQGCGSAGYDHREKIANATLFNQNGVLDGKAFAGALTEKFAAANSPPAALASFVETIGGKCSTPLSEVMSCSVPQSGSVCLSSRIEITASVPGGVLKEIKATTQHHGC